MKLHTTIGGEQVTLEIPATAGSSPTFLLDGEPYEATVSRIGPGAYSIIAAGRSYDVRVHARPGGILDVAVNGVTHPVTVTDPRRWTPGDTAGGAAGPRQIKAPMPGKVVKVLVREGEEVTAGQGVAVVEAMKMQNEMKSPRAGTVLAVKVVEGGAVAAGDALVVID